MFPDGLRAARLLIVALLASLIGPAADAQQPTYDLLIRNGRVIDGTGAPSVRADVAITGDRVALVSPTAIPAARARRVIDATGRVVAPGFIDLHTHLEPLLAMPDAESHVRQGVTLAVGGPDGTSEWPMGSFLDRAAAAGLGLNVAFLVGHNTIRREVMGTANRAPTAVESARMQEMVGRAMHEGAFGLSTGLRYIPGFYATTAEVVALSKVAADSGGIYTSHMREEGLGLLEGVGEALEIGRQAGIPVVLTHHKAVGRQMWGKSTITLAMVDSARKAGTDVMIDQYPYTASSTGLSILVPPWALAGGDSALARRMNEPALRDSILRGVADLLLNDRGGGDLKRVQFASVPWDPSLNGKTLHDLAVKRGVPTTFAAVAPLVVDGVLRGDPTMVYHVLDEGDVRRIMAHPQTMIASDGLLTRLGDGVPHPRNYGTFPRVLGKYVRTDHVLTLEDAVRKMTSMPASRLRLTDRGCLRQGCFADITVFNPQTVADKGTFAEPHQYPSGIEWVIVNGTPVVERGTFTRARPGRVLRRAPGLQRQTSSDLGALTDRVFAAWRSPAGPGCAVGIDRPGEPRFTRAYGSADLENAVPNRPETIFEAGSVSKQFTAAATVLLALDGKIGLDDDVRQYVPELPRYERPITIRHLLNHTSGLRDWGDIVSLEGWPRGTRAFTHDDVLQVLMRQRASNYPAGDRYAYTNSGYNLLAMIVTRVSKTSFSAFTAERLFKPLGMTSTQWRDDFTRLVKGRAQAYSMGPAGWRLDMPFENIYGNSSLLTTVSDLLTWTAMLDNPPSAWRALAESLHVRGRLTNGDTITYALGLVIDRYRGVRRVEHNGATAGYRADLARFPGKGVAIALLCNAGDVVPRTPTLALSDALLAADLAPAPAPASPPTPTTAAWTPTASDLAGVTGAYYSPEVLSVLTLTVENGALTLFRAPATKVTLRPTTREHYAGFGEDVWFSRGADGRVNALHVRTTRAFDVVYERQR